MNTIIDQNIIDQIISLRINKKYGYKRIARELKLSLNQVSDILIQNGITDHITMPDETVVKMIIDMYTNQLKSLKDISKYFKMSVMRIENILKCQGFQIGQTGYHIGHNNKLDEHYFDNIDTEHKAYWLGLLYADGYNNEKAYQIELCLKTSDRILLESFKQDIKSVYDIRDRIVTLDGKQFSSSRFTLYSKYLSRILSEKGCIQCKSLSLTFPSEKIVPKYLQHHFMRGYFDGDGCISGNKFMVLGTQEFVEKYVSILRNNTNISEAGGYYPNGKAIEWQHASKRDLIKIYNYLYQNATIYLKRKHDRFIKKEKPSVVEILQLLYRELLETPKAY